MTDQERAARLLNVGTMELEQCERRNFLVSLGKWSKAVIGGVVLGGLLAPGRAAKAWGWANHNDGNKTWVNFGGDWGWGPGWYNGGWNNRPWYNGGWHNRPWYNGGWHNRGWYNRPWRRHDDWHNHGGRHRHDDHPRRGGDWFNR